jgi:hypothetical protein
VIFTISYTVLYLNYGYSLLCFVSTVQGAINHVPDYRRYRYANITVW